jgi:type III secretion protein J
MPSLPRHLRFLVAFVLALLLAGCGSTVELMSATPETEANEMLGVLLEAGIRAEKVGGKEGNVSIRVGHAEVSRAIETLRSRGLPRERFARMGEVFKKEGLISSPLEERARYLWALSQELASTISQIDGVITARVHVVLPERGVAGDASIPSSAAVFIKHREGFDLEPVLPQVKRLVTNSIAGLSGEKVSVVLVPSALAPAAAAGAGQVSVFGITMQGSSVGSFWMLLGLLALVAVGALATAGYLAWRILPASPRGAAAAGTQPAAGSSAAG